VSASARSVCVRDVSLDYGFTKKEGDARWRIPIALQGVFAIAALVMLLFFPDTPRWYYARGREQDGDTALAQLTGCDSSAPLFRQTKQEILAAIEMELAANKSLKWTDFLTFGLLDKSPEKIVRRLSMCFWLTFCRQWAGINLIVYCKSPLLLMNPVQRNHRPAAHLDCRRSVAQPRLSLGRRGHDLVLSWHDPPFLYSRADRQAQASVGRYQCKLPVLGPNVRLIGNRLRRSS
jgi:hypothetical protein